MAALRVNPVIRTSICIQMYLFFSLHIPVIEDDEITAAIC